MYGRMKLLTELKGCVPYADRYGKALASISFGNELEYKNNIDVLVKILIIKRKKRRNVYFIGNGGSAGIAMHMTVDFLKNGKMKTRSMHDAPTITCLGNDYGYEQVFSKQLEIVAEEGDVLVAISSSGNSQNILEAVNVAKEKGCTIVTFSGFKPENRLRQIGDYNIYVPSMEYGIVESIHNMILQQIVDEIMAIDKEAEES